MYFPEREQIKDLKPLENRVENKGCSDQDEVIIKYNTVEKCVHYVCMTYIISFSELTEENIRNRTPEAEEEVGSFILWLGLKAVFKFFYV